MIGAEALREILEGKVASQTMIGHMAWVYVWPDDIDVDHVVAKLTPPEKFRSEHGLSEPEPEKEAL